MSAEDYMDSAVEYDEWDRGDLGEPSYAPRAYKRRPRFLPVCKYCGEPDLHWGQDDNGWRLYSADNQPHKCAPKPRPPFNPSAILAPTMKTANLPPQPPKGVLS